MNILITAGAAIGLLIYAAKSSAAPSYDQGHDGLLWQEPPQQPENFWGGFPDVEDLIFSGGVSDDFDYTPREPVESYDFGWLNDFLPGFSETGPNVINDPNANLAAFLAVIRTGEGTADADGYRRVYGGALFDSYADHPANMGWRGVELPANYCGAVGKGPGCVSTAAGAYQQLKPTWNRVKQRLGLRDFSPANQDAAAIELIREQGALDDVQAGRFDEAIQKVADVWASLPGSPYGQPVISLAKAQRIYAENGGSFA